MKQERFEFGPIPLWDSGRNGMLLAHTLRKRYPRTAAMVTHAFVAGVAAYISNSVWTDRVNYKAEQAERGKAYNACLMRDRICGEFPYADRSKLLDYNELMNGVYLQNAPDKSTTTDVRVLESTLVSKPTLLVPRV